MFFKALLFCLMLASSFLGFSVQLENYFKKPTQVSEKHKMKGIDWIVTINLDKRPEKFASCVKQLEPYGIFPYRFSAVNGWELTLDDLNKLGIKYDPNTMTHDIWGTSYLPENNGNATHEVMSVPGKNYYSHCMSRGSIGIVLSHLSILQYAYDAGYDTIWVMEDDIEVLKDPHLITARIHELDSLVGKKGWDIFFTDQDTKNQQGKYVPCRSYAKRPNYTPLHTSRFAQRKEISPNIRQIGARYGAYSMVVRRSGMKKILDFIKKYQIFLPYDMEFYLPVEIRMFSVTDDIVSTQIRAASDNGAPRYLETNTMNNRPV